MTTPQFTLADLDAMTDSELDALAATTIKQWTRQQVGAWEFWYDGDRRTAYTVSRGIGSWQRDDWHPTADRNQSGDLLKALAARGAEFRTHSGNKTNCDGVITYLTPPLVYWQRQESIPGNSARSEVLAGLLAWQALENAK